MKITRITHVLWPCLLAIPLVAQPQIGGGVCNSSTLKGTYSLTLTGRDYGPGIEYAHVLQSIGTATFDGLSAVTFSVTTNTNVTAGTNQPSGTPQTMSGTYSLQSNCIGALNITSGGSASYVLGAFNSGANYFITGQDGANSLIGSGNTLPTTSCSASTLDGTYSFNGNGYGIMSLPGGSDLVLSVNEVSGLMTFDGAGNVTANWFLTVSGAGTSPATVKGTYSVASGCTATAQLVTSAGAEYHLVFTITASNGSFVFNALTADLIFAGSGRPL